MTANSQNYYACMMARPPSSTSTNARLDGFCLFQTHFQSSMETLCDHFFPGWGEKQVELPPAINTKPETILGILHNHHLLVQNLCPGLTIKSIEHAPYTTTFILRDCTRIIPTQIEVIFTSLNDGISLVKSLRSGVSIEIRWTVTKTTTTPEQYALRKTCTVSGDQLSNILFRLDDRYDCRMKRFLRFLGRRKVFMGDARLSEGKVLLTSSEQQRRVDAAKLKKD